MKTITIKSNGIGRYDDISPFLVTDKKLDIKVELPNLSGEFYLIAQNNGKTYKKYLPGNRQVSLEELTAGELQIKIVHYLKGVRIVSYEVEPLMLIEADATIEGTPEIAQLQSDATALKTSITDLQKSVTQMEANIFALIRFAFKDYSENVYLSGGSLDDFIKEYGFILSNEQINVIKGEEK